MADDRRSSRKPVSLNDRHYRLLQDLSSVPPKPRPSSILNEEERGGEIERRRHLYKPSTRESNGVDVSAPPFFGIADFDSSREEAEIDEEESFKVKLEGRCLSLKSSTRVNDGVGVDRSYHDISATHFSGMADFESAQDTLKEEKLTKVKMKGRRRLCKFSSRGCEDTENGGLVEDECGYANISDFDSPGLSRFNPGVSDIRDILNDLSSKLGLLSIEKKKRVPEGTDKVEDNYLNKSKVVQPEYEIVESTFSNLSDPSDSLSDVANNAEGYTEEGHLQCHSSVLETGISIDDGKKDVFLTVDKLASMRKSIVSSVEDEEESDLILESGGRKFAARAQNAKKNCNRLKKEQPKMVPERLRYAGGYFVSNLRDEEEEDDDCQVFSGKQMVKESVGNGGKYKESFDHSSGVDFLDDCEEESVLAEEDSFSLAGPVSTFKLPSKVAKILYPHQREGLQWLWSLHCRGKGGILGDDMGLGKTMQICGFLAGLFHTRLIKRALVVAPKTLLSHWVKELSIVGLSGMTREYFGTSAKAREYELQYILQDKGVLLTTYDIVRNNSKALQGDHYFVLENEDSVTWDYMILDELNHAQLAIFGDIREITLVHACLCTKSIKTDFEEVLVGCLQNTAISNKAPDQYRSKKGHLIKNPSTQRAKSLLDIPSAHRIVISGTPIQNNLKELWALLNFCCPGLLGDNKWFKEKYEHAILRGNEKNASDRDKRIGSAVAKELRECIQPYFLRRLKNEVFKEDDTKDSKLSKKSEIIVWLRLTSCQRQLYESFLQSELVLSAFDGSPLAALTTLKKICDHPLLLTKRAAEDVLEGMDSMLNQEDACLAEKLAMHIADAAERDAFEEKHDSVSCKISFILVLLDNLVPQGHSILIFSQTRKMLNLIQESLVSNGYKFLRIDGTTKASERVKIVNDFQEGFGAPIFLLTSQVGGLGLTLTRADRVIVVDPAWNPSTDNQSVDRAYRIGQKKDVLVYRLMTCGTVEEKIYRKQIFKGGLFKSATEHKEQIRYFSQQDLRELFSLPKQGFDISVTQQQLHEEHDSQHEVDESLGMHLKFLETQGIAGVSHHSLLFSKTAPVQAVTQEEEEEEEEEIRRRHISFVGKAFSGSSIEPNVDGARHAFKPKDSTLNRKSPSPDKVGKQTESEIKERINRLSQILANKVTVSRLPDGGAKLQKQIADLSSELNKIRMEKCTEKEVIDVDDLTGELDRVLNV